MGDYFKPWRRKVGILTLVMACVLMGGWVRSVTTEDEIRFNRVFGQCHSFASLAGAIEWVRWHWHSPPLKAIEWRSGNNQRQFYIVWFSTRQYQMSKMNKPIGTAEGFIIPYWVLVVPLTLISAFLLLTKPRKSIQKKLTESIPETLA